MMAADDENVKNDSRLFTSSHMIECDLKIDYHNLYVVSQILKAEIPEKELDIFDENWSETEYRGMILYSLMHYMSWPEFRGNYTNSNETITFRKLYFEEAFEHHESPNSAAAEIGYGCG